VQLAGDLDLELRLMEERNDEIFQQLERRSRSPSSPSTRCSAPWASTPTS
jgi:hypothetical protein